MLSIVDYSLPNKNKNSYNKVFEVLNFVNTRPKFLF